MDLHSLVGGKELPTGRALYVLHLEVHALHMGVQPVLVDELSRACLAGVGLLLKIARQFFPPVVNKQTGIFIPTF